jgi:hypothetical protein
LNFITSPLKKPLDSFNATIEDIIVLHPAEVQTGYKRRNVREGPVHKKKQALPVQKRSTKVSQISRDKENEGPSMSDKRRGKQKGKRVGE